MTLDKAIRDLGESLKREGVFHGPSGETIKAEFEQVVFCVQQMKRDHPEVKEEAEKLGRKVRRLKRG